MYMYRLAFQGVGRPCRGQRTFWAQLEPDYCALGNWVLPRRCCGKSRLGLTTAALRKYPSSTGTEGL